MFLSVVNVADSVYAVAMASIERVTIALPVPMADRMRSAVESGEYATTSEIVRDALRLWESRRDLREREIMALRQAWNEGKASGEPVPFDMDGIVSAARAKLKSGRRG